MVQVVWLKSARNDLLEIFEFIAKDSKRYAKLQVNKIQSATELLKSDVEIGRIVPELNDYKIREIIVRNYRIIYRILNAELIHVLFIHHTSRKFPRKF